MTARDWFESIRADVVEMIELERKIETIENQVGPHGQQVGSIGGHGVHDSMRGIDHLVDLGEREKLERMKARVNARVTAAFEVLYGRSGSGGLAKAKSSLDADILCCYYLQGEEWPAIAAGVARDGVTRPNGWVRLRAMRALRFMDHRGVSELAES